MFFFLRFAIGAADDAVFRRFFVGFKPTTPLAVDIPTFLRNPSPASFSDDSLFSTLLIAPGAASMALFAADFSVLVARFLRNGSAAEKNPPPDCWYRLPE